MVGDSLESECACCALRKLKEIANTDFLDVGNRFCRLYGLYSWGHILCILQLSSSNLGMMQLYMHMLYLQLTCKIVGGISLCFHDNNNKVALFCAFEILWQAH